MGKIPYLRNDFFVQHSFWPDDADDTLEFVAFKLSPDARQVVKGIVVEVFGPEHTHDFVVDCAKLV